MRTLSCDFGRLYARGGWYEGDEVAEASFEHGSFATWIADAYPSYEYDRALPASIASASDDETERVFRQYAQWDAHYRRGAASNLYRFETTVLYDRTLYAFTRGEWVAVNETHRQAERPHKTVSPVFTSLSAARPRSENVDYLYVGTVGSENYAHWLVDDLTRALVLMERFGQERQAVLLLDKYFPAIDQVRYDSLQALGNERVSIQFIEKKQAYFFDALHYVTPNSYHPFLKSPQALGAVRERLYSADEAAPRRLFVTRNGNWRNLLNANDVARALEARGFTTVAVEGVSFREQVRLFSQAETIVGVSGAAMVNTLFAPLGARTYYLAGNGFIDPFYWDLAATRGDEYRVCFGTPWKPEQPTFSSFTLEDAQLAQLLAWL